MAVNTLVQQLGLSCLGGADVFMRDVLHLSGKGAAVFAHEISGTVDSGLGSIKIFWWANLV